MQVPPMPRLPFNKRKKAVSLPTEAVFTILPQSRRHGERKGQAPEVSVTAGPLYSEQGTPSLTGRATPRDMKIEFGYPLHREQPVYKQRKFKIQS